MAKLEVAEGLLECSSSERLPFTVDFADYGVTTLSSATVAVYDEADESGGGITAITATVATSIATLSLFRGATKGHTYRVEVLGVEGTSYYETYFRIACIK